MRINNNVLDSLLYNISTDGYLYNNDKDGIRMNNKLVKELLLDLLDARNEIKILKEKLNNEGHN